MATAQEDTPWIATVDEILSNQRTSLSQGLSSEEVARRREQYGTNELQKEPGTDLMSLIIKKYS
jgi:magnesium-transporting ATPase (P-type)